MADASSMFSVAGKRAIVTGGARGLCNAMAQALHDGAAEVVLVDVDGAALEEAASKMGASGAPVHCVVADLSDLEGIPAAYDRALEALGGCLDILVNGAGIQYRERAVDFPLDRWEKIIDINLSAIFVLAQLAGRTMTAQGSGKIINVASMTSFFGSEMVPAYAASKGGVMQLTKALSNEWAGSGVCVNAIAPGYMQTALTNDMKEKNPAQYQEITNRIPAHRWGSPDDLRGVVVFLASTASDYISGAIVPVDGGYLGK